jgi:hypothetical protein
VKVDANEFSIARVTILFKRKYGIRFKKGGVRQKKLKSVERSTFTQ